MDVETLYKSLVDLDDGVIMHGEHTEGTRQFCALEFVNTIKGAGFSSRPVFMPDLRGINDARWGNDQSRTVAILPVIAALWDWTTWPLQRQVRWAETVVINTVKQIISELPFISTDIVNKCRSTETLDQAEAVAHMARAELSGKMTMGAAAAEIAAERMAMAAKTVKEATNMWALIVIGARVAAAVQVAESASWVVRNSTKEGPEAVLKLACDIWVEAAESTDVELLGATQ